MCKGSIATSAWTGTRSLSQAGTITRIFAGPSKASIRRRKRRRRTDNAPAQSRRHEPKFDNSHEAYEARHAALSEILKERLESGKINSSEASRAMFSFECDGSLKYRNEVIARMWKHRDLQEMRDIAAEVRGCEQAERQQRSRDGAVNGGKQRN